ncbi:hypothetical protein OAG82_00180 [Rubripirellula sp.]|nr:hypothetical protein [Rubripirellula sp.]
MSSWLNTLNGTSISAAHVLSIMPMKKILKVSSGQMQSAMTNDTGQFSARFVWIAVGGAWYGLPMSDFECEVESNSDKV